MAVIAALVSLGIPAAATATHGDNFEGALPLAIGEPATIAGYEADPNLSSEAYTDQTDAGEERELDCGRADIGLDGSVWWTVRQGKRRLSATVTGQLGKTAALHATGAVDSWDWCAYNTGTGPASFTFPQTYAEGQTLYIRAGACYRITPAEYCGASGGDLTMRVTSAPPGNNARASATEVGAGPQQEFDNHGATQEDEVLSCTSNGKTAAYRSTVWFRYTPAKFGTATFTASETRDHIDTVLSVYRGNEAQPVECFDNPDTPAGGSTVSLPVSAGQAYFVQVGSFASVDEISAQGTFLFDVRFATVDGDGDGDPDLTDCAPDDPSRHRGAADVPHNNIDEDCVGGDNKDGDGDRHAANFAGGDDCDDRNPHIHPGVADVPNNAVDDNCDGRDDAARLPTTPQVSFRSAPFGRGVVFATMYVRDLRKGYRVEIRCKRSRSCPRPYRTTVRRGRAVAFQKFRRRAFRSRAQIEVFVTMPGNVIGFYKSYTVRGRRNPKQRVCEVDPGAPRRPVRCR